MCDQLATREAEVEVLRRLNGQQEEIISTMAEQKGDLVQLMRETLVYFKKIRPLIKGKTDLSGERNIVKMLDKLGMKAKVPA